MSNGRGDRARVGERLRCTSVVGGVMDHPTIGQEYGRVGRMTESGGVLHDRIEHWLDVFLRLRDGPQDLARGRLLLQRFCLAFQGFGQALLQVANPSVGAPGRRPGGRPLTLDLRLRGLGTPPHQRLLGGQIGQEPRIG